MEPGFSAQLAQLSLYPTIAVEPPAQKTTNTLPSFDPAPTAELQRNLEDFLQTPWSDDLNLKWMLWFIQQQLVLVSDILPIIVGEELLGIIGWEFLSKSRYKEHVSPECQARAQAECQKKPHTLTVRFALRPGTDHRAVACHVQNVLKDILGAAVVSKLFHVEDQENKFSLFSISKEGQKLHFMFPTLLNHPYVATQDALQIRLNHNFEPVIEDNGVGNQWCLDTMHKVVRVVHSEPKNLSKVIFRYLQTGSTFAQNELEIMKGELIFSSPEHLIDFWRKCGGDKIQNMLLLCQLCAQAGSEGLLESFIEKAGASLDALNPKNFWHLSLMLLREKKIPFREFETILQCIALVGDGSTANGSVKITRAYRPDALFSFEDAPFVYHVPVVSQLVAETCLKYYEEMTLLCKTLFCESWIDLLLNRQTGGRASILLGLQVAAAQKCIWIDKLLTNDPPTAISLIRNISDDPSITATDISRWIAGSNVLCRALIVNTFLPSAFTRGLAGPILRELERGNHKLSSANISCLGCAIKGFIEEQGGSSLTACMVRVYQSYKKTPLSHEEKQLVLACFSKPESVEEEFARWYLSLVGTEELPLKLQPVEQVRNFLTVGVRYPTLIHEAQREYIEELHKRIGDVEVRKALFDEITAAKAEVDIGFFDTLFGPFLRMPKEKQEQKTAQSTGDAEAIRTLLREKQVHLATNKLLAQETSTKSLRALAGDCLTAFRASPHHKMILLLEKYFPDSLEHWESAFDEACLDFSWLASEEVVGIFAKLHFFKTFLKQEHYDFVTRALVSLLEKKPKLREQYLCYAYEWYAMVKGNTPLGWNLLALCRKTDGQELIQNSCQLVKRLLQPGNTVSTDSLASFVAVTKCPSYATVAQATLCPIVKQMQAAGAHYFTLEHLWDHPCQSVKEALWPSIVFWTAFAEGESFTRLNKQVFALQYDLLKTASSALVLEIFETCLMYSKERPSQNRALKPAPEKSQEAFSCYTEAYPRLLTLCSEEKTPSHCVRALDIDISLRLYNMQQAKDIERKVANRDELLRGLFLACVEHHGFSEVVCSLYCYLVHYTSLEKNTYPIRSAKEISDLAYSIKPSDGCFSRHCKIVHALLEQAKQQGSLPDNAQEILKYTQRE